MPKRMNKTKKTKRRGYRRRRTRQGYNQSSNDARVLAFTQASPLPKNFKATQIYSDPFISLTASGAGVPASRVYSCNGLFDPDITGVGHQCSGFDQLMTMFDHYCVIGARISVTFTNFSTDFPMLCCVDIRDSPTTTTDYREAIESGTCKSALVSVSNSGASTATIVYNVNPAKFLGRSKPLADPDLKGSASANPVEQCYFHVIIAGDGAEKVGASITIEYISMFIEPKPVGLS